MGLMERGIEALERIATALENVDSAILRAETPNASEDKPPPKKKAASNKKVVGKEKQIDPDAPDKQAVRDALQTLQKATTPAQAKSILKAHGASTLGNLDEVKYQQVIDECASKMPE